VTSNGRTDAVTTNFGVRHTSFTATGGFELNGVPMKLQGGCVHHDNGALGSKVIDRADERRVEALKANGYNAIRTSHNPVSQAFVAACDKLGVMLMEEAFDCWDTGKNTDDYNKYFWGWWRRDISAMVCTHTPPPPPHTSCTYFLLFVTFRPSSLSFYTCLLCFASRILCHGVHTHSLRHPLVLINNTGKRGR
jgi:hypothetical protein